MENSSDLPDLRATGPEGGEEGISHPRPAKTLLSRNYFGWILLVVFFAFVISGALRQSYGRETPIDPEVKTAERALESSIALRDVLGQRETSGASAQKGLKDARQSVTGDSGEAAFLRMVIDRELGRKPTREDVARARKVPEDLKATVPLVTAEKPAKVSPAEEGDRFSVRLAKAQARERAGTPRDEARKGLIRADYLPRFFFFSFGLLGAAALGIALLMWYGISRGSGAFRPLGLPSLPMTSAEGDRFALRAALMFGSFLLGSAIVALLRLPTSSALILQTVFMGAIAVYSLRLPPDSKVPHLSAVGMALNTNHLGQRIAWGVAGAFANLPILLVVSILSNALLKNAPPPSHPSTEALLQNPNFGTILITFFLASVCAPIWEEMMFRGLLFQGLAGIKIKPVIAAVISSFLFAAIHPQGLAAWPALASVALMSCALLAQTRSLVPSMVMHATHNSLLLLVAIIAGPVIG